jgi:hypothetical protein
VEAVPWPRQLTDVTIAAPTIGLVFAVAAWMVNPLTTVPALPVVSSRVEPWLQSGSFSMMVREGPPKEAKPRSVGRVQVEQS